MCVCLCVCVRVVYMIGLYDFIIRLIVTWVRVFVCACVCVCVRLYHTNHTHNNKKTINSHISIHDAIDYMPIVHALCVLHCTHNTHYTYVRTLDSSSQHKHIYMYKIKQKYANTYMHRTEQVKWSNAVNHVVDEDGYIMPFHIITPDTSLSAHYSTVHASEIGYHCLFHFIQRMTDNWFYDVQ